MQWQQFLLLPSRIVQNAWGRGNAAATSAPACSVFCWPFFYIFCIFFFGFFYVHAKPNSLNGSNDAGRTSPKRSLEKGAQLGCICNELPLQQQQQHSNRQQQQQPATAMAISNMAAWAANEAELPSLLLSAF